MWALPRRCPECRAPLGGGPSRQDGEKLRCPRCGSVIVSAGSATRALTICAALALGLLVLGGGAAAWFAASRAPAGPVAVAVPPPPAEVPPSPAASARAAPPPAKPQPPPPPAEPEKPEPLADPLSLQELKAASVYIEAEMSNRAASGSGFVVRRQGDTAYVVTNRHVITTPREAVGVGPRGRFGLAPPPFVVIRPGRRAESITVVFRSGTPQQQAHAAATVGEDEEADLAVLKVSGVRDLPRPIDWARPARLTEKMPVRMLGFPFGHLLGPGQPSPAITVTRGALRDVRRNRLSAPLRVEISADVNPGNSGGPVVDERGALVGVIAAKWRDTDVGILVPVPPLRRLLDGHIDLPMSTQRLLDGHADPPLVTRTEVIDGWLQVQVICGAADPLGRLGSPVLLYGPTGEVKMAARRGDGWGGLAGARAAKLKVGPSRAVAELALDVPARGELKVILQVSYRNETGQTVYGEPHLISVFDPRAPRPAVTRIPVPMGKWEPWSRTKWVRGEELTKLLAGLKSADGATRRKAAEALAEAPPRQRRKEVAAAARDLLLGRDDSAAGLHARAAAASVLVACAPEEAVPALVLLLNDEAMCETALYFLTKLKDPGTAGAVAAALPRVDNWPRHALLAIGPPAEKAVLPYLGHPDSNLRQAALNLLKEIGAEASLPVLEELARGRGYEAQLAREALPAVRERAPLKDDEWPRALEDLGSSDLRVLQGALRRVAVTPPVAARRAGVLARLAGAASAARTPPEEVKTALQGLVRWGGPEAVPLLARRLEGKNDSLKTPLVIDALGELKDEAAAAAVVKHLRRPRGEFAGHSTQALKAMGPVAEKPVLALLASAEPFHRKMAAQVLEEIGGRASLSPLEKARRDNEPFCAPDVERALTAVKDRLEDPEAK